MDKTLNREILRLSVPSIFANLTVPLVGLVDTAVSGHLDGHAAAFIGAISIGAMLFNLLYWNFGFLRTGTGGLTAQAFGRNDTHDCAVILLRGLMLSVLIATVTLLLQYPFVKLALSVTVASADVELLAYQYFMIRIWAAPATLSLMTFSGWFVGMQDSVSSMWKDIIVNGVNILASVFLALGIGEWNGLGFSGVALGTVIAQYSGLLFCILVCIFKYHRKVFVECNLQDMYYIFDLPRLKSFFKLNADLFGRSLFFTIIYIGYTIIAATLGDMMLACSSIMMQLLMIFSYFTDGFAYAAEALTGRFLGARDKIMMQRSVLYTFVWSMVVGLLFTLVYAFASVPMLNLLTDDLAVIMACSQFLPWLLLMPLIGCAAFFWDGVFLGATASRGLRNSMIGAAVFFFVIWFLSRFFIGSTCTDTQSLNILLASYFGHLLFRTVYLSFAYPLQVRNLLSGIATAESLNV